VHDQLLRDTENPGSYILLAEWEDEQAFRKWEDDPVHRKMAEPMYPYWANGGIVRRILEVRAELGSRTGPT
jgi:heme-degrading monooxygenase HmoA